MNDQLTLKREVQRKLIHFITSLIPIFYIFIITKKEHIYLICVIMTIGFLFADLLRMYWKIAEKYFLKIFSVLLRKGEFNQQLTGATYLFIGLTLSVILFPKEIAVPIMLFLTIADPIAAIVGKSIPIKKVMHKSIGGFFAFLICAIIICLLFMDFTFVTIIVALTAAIVELLPLKINDNLTIPIISGYMLVFLR